MSNQNNIEALERRYQRLFADFQTNRLDEAVFLAEVDKLQFQDDLGRYWMMGAQTGNWHYFDGQTWHQADPREADNLPFIDEQGVYWQRGVKSGEWYYFHPDREEWVKPPDEPNGYDAAPGYHPTDSRPMMAEAPVAPGIDPTGFEGELFQDDEGRYWSLGAKTGQWYFYDHDGWHPAHDLPGSSTGQPQPDYEYAPTDYTPPPSQPTYPQGQIDTHSYAPQGYAPQPQQPQTPSQPFQPQPGVGSPPVQVYVVSPGQEVAGQPGPTPPPSAEPSPVERPPLPKEENIPPRQPVQRPSDDVEPKPVSPPAVEETPPVSHLPDEMEIPPRQWHADPEVAAETPSPAPQLPVQEVEPEIEVVDVEVVAIVEPEPEPEPRQPKSAPSVAKTPPPSVAVEDDDSVVPPGSAIPEEEDVTPRRRHTQPMKPQPADPEPSKPSAESLQPQPTEPPPPSPSPTGQRSPVVIPTGADPSTISIRPPRPVSRPMRNSTRPVSPQQQRRAREQTVPMETTSAASPEHTTPHHRPTQPTPAQTTRARSDTDEFKTPPANQPAAQSAAPAAQPAAAEPEKEGLTLGEFLGSFSMTMWTAIIGGALLIFACVGITFSGGLLNASGVNEAGLAGLPGFSDSTTATPTLDIDSVPDATPTPRPTATSAQPTPTRSVAAESVAFNSEELDFALEYPENWLTEETADVAIFSPSEVGLDIDELADSAMWIGQTTDESDVSTILADVLAEFPLDAEELNKGSIGIGGQMWTSVQIRYDDENLGGQAVATIAVTVRDGIGYYLVAAAPSTEWNTLKPVFQSMINSFSFGTLPQGTPLARRTATRSLEAEAETTDEAAEDADATPEDDEPADTVTPEATSEADDEEADAETATPTPTATEEATATPTNTPTATSTPTPEATPTPTPTLAPLIYTIESGDTLSRIAQQFGIDVDLLASENGLNKEGTLQIGDNLIIPFTDEELKEYYGVDENAPQPTATPTEAPADDETAEDEEDEDEETPDDEESATATPQPTATPTEAPAAEITGRIIYPAFDAGQNTYNLWLADLNTNEQNVVAGEASQPDFSRDGGLLAYRSWDLRSRGVLYRDYVGGNDGKVTTFVEDGLPAWSPDGSWFVFSSRREGDRQPRLYRTDPINKIEQGIAFEGVYPDIMADGRIVARGCLPGGVDCGLYVMGPTGGGPQKIGSTSDTAPAAAPSGSKIAFMSNGRGGSNWEIWTINADGSEPQRLTENRNDDGLPTWSPDGRSIAYVSNQGGSWAVWVMNVDGSNQRKLFDMRGSPDGKVQNDLNNSFGWWEERISWAP